MSETPLDPPVIGDGTDKLDPTATDNSPRPEDGEQADLDQDPDSAYEPEGGLTDATGEPMTAVEGDTVTGDGSGHALPEATP